MVELTVMVVEEKMHVSLQNYRIYMKEYSMPKQTNNHAKAANRRLNTEKRACNQIYGLSLIVWEVFKKATIIFLAQLLAGASLLKKFKKYTQHNHRLHKIVSEYNNRKLIYYFKGITHNTLLKQNYNNLLFYYFLNLFFCFYFIRM